MTLYCTTPRVEAALSDGPLSAACPAGHLELVFAPGWWCEDCGCSVFPDLIRDADEEPDGDYS
jgi:hypothetical protein